MSGWMDDVWMAMLAKFSLSFFFLVFIYLGCARPKTWHVGSLLAPARFLIANN